MSRNTSGYHTYTRGKAKNFWVWWSDGGGKKVQKRILNEDGNPVAAQASRREADRHAARMYHEWCCLAGQSTSELKPGSCDHAQETVSRTLGELTARFVLSHQSDWSHRTKNGYGTQLRYIEEFLGVGTPLDLIPPEQADNFKLFLVHEKKLSSETIKSKLEMARRVFNFGIRLKWIAENPFVGTKPPRKKKMRDADPFSPEEVTRILNTARLKYPDFYPLVLTAALTGERRNSVRMLDVGDVNLESMILTFRAIYMKQRVEIKRPIPEAVQPLFRKLVEGRAPEEPLFVDEAGERWRDVDLNPYQSKPKNYLRLFGCLLRDAGVRIRGMHNFRSGVDTNLVDAGMTLDQATAVTGHTKKVAEEAYLRLQVESKRKAMDTLAEAYGIGALDNDQNQRTNGPRTAKRSFKVELSEEEVRAIEELAARSGLESQSDSGTNPGTSPRRNGTNSQECREKAKKSAVSAFAD